MAKYFAPPGTGVQAALLVENEDGELVATARTVEWDESGVVEVPDDDTAMVDFLARFADSPAHQVTSQPPEAAAEPESPEPRKPRRETTP